MNVNVSVTARAAARLLLSGEMDLTGHWPDRMAEEVLEKLLRLPVEELIEVADWSPCGMVADVKEIPQFAKIEMVEKVPAYFTQTGQPSVDYAQLGFYLRGDQAAKLDAKIKFGENHGKGAALLGLAVCTNARIRPSSLSGVFAALPPERQRALSRRLLFRIPTVQILLRSAGQGRVNGFAPLVQLSWSTMKRRSQSVKRIFQELERLENPALCARIERIYWDEEEVLTNAAI